MGWVHMRKVCYPHGGFAEKITPWLKFGETFFEQLETPLLLSTTHSIATHTWDV